MSHDTNVGTIRALEEGVVSSTSIMMPCSWVGEIAQYVKSHPQVDAGLHLTLTSEWDFYRWGPVAGRSAVPGLTDMWGCLWDNVPLVIQHASPDEVETEIRAQIARAYDFGIPVTHLDSHMGTLFASPAFFERYMQVGIEKGLPILAPDLPAEKLAVEAPQLAGRIKAAIQEIWNAGLPVIDDIVTENYGWEPALNKQNYLATLRALKPGVTEMIVHCAAPGNEISAITASAPRRNADLASMIDPEIKHVILEEKIILTNWRELKARRDQVAGLH